MFTEFSLLSSGPAMGAGARSGMCRSRTLLCAAILAAMILSASAATGKVPSNTLLGIQVVADTPTEFEIEESESDGQSRRFFCQRLRSDLAQDSWLIRLDSGSIEVFSAHVIVSAGQASVSGVVSGTPFHYFAALRENDMAFLSRSFGNVHVSVVFDLANREEPRNMLAAQHLQRHKLALANHPANVMLANMSNAVSEMLERSGHPESIGQVTAVALNAPGAPVAPLSIKSYMECLESACRYNGGCWYPSGCNSCPGDPLWTVFLASTLYGIDAEICFVRHILNPIKW